MATAHISQSGNLNAIQVFASVTEQSASGNYRTIYLNVWASPQDGYTGGRDADWIFRYIDAYGREVNLASPNTTVITDSMSIFSGTITVYVDAGETSAYPDISFSAQFYSPSLKAYRSATGSIDQISELSLVADTTITSAKDIYFGDVCRIVWTPASSSFHYKLKFALGEDSFTTNVISPNQTEEYIFTDFSPPVEWANNIPNNTYGTVRVSLTQYEDSGATITVGSPSSSTFKVTLKDDVLPTINSCVVQINNEANDVVDSWGIALSGYSKLTILADSSGAYGSKITSYNITGDYTASITLFEEDGSLKYTGTIVSTSGNKQFGITCTDSRGRTSEVMLSDMVFVNPYSPPRIKKFSISKNTNDTDEISDDTMSVLAVWEYDDISVEINDGIESYNTSSAVLEYRTGVDTGWVTYGASIPNNTPFTLSELTLTESASYNFRLVVTDALGRRSEKETFSSVRTVLMDFQAGGKGLGIGKICQIDNSEKDAGSLEVSMDSYFWRNMQLLGEASLVISSNMYGTEDPNVKFAGSEILPGQVYFKKVGG